MQIRTFALPVLLIVVGALTSGCALGRDAAGVEDPPTPPDRTPTSTMPSPSPSPSDSPVTDESPASEAPEGMWIGQSIYHLDSSQRFMVEFDEGEWQLTMEGVVGVLTHRELEGCQIRSTAGHGLGPDWTALNSLTTIGQLQFETVEARYRDELEFVSLYTDAGTEYYSGFQVGVEDVSQECLDRSYEVLSTFQVVNP